MNLFGIPIFVSYEYFETFVATNLTITVTSDFMFIGWLIANFMYLFALGLFVSFTYKIIIIIKNHWLY